MTSSANPRPSRRSGVLVVLSLLLAVLLGGCAGGAAAPSAGVSSGGEKNITVGVIPIVDTAAFRLGVSKGFFKEKGLNITLQDAQGGAAIVPAVLSGSNQIGFSNLSSLVIGKEKNMPLRLMAAGVQTTGDDDKDFGGIVALPKANISSPKNLAGKTVAVNTLKNIGDTTVRHAVEEDGGDPAAVKFVEMPFPDMPAALSAGRIDAAWMVEPFMTITQGQGAKVVSYNFPGFDPNLQVGGFFTSTQYATQNPDVVTSFNDALKRSNEYATANPDELRTFLSTYTKITPDVQKEMVLPKWPTDLELGALQKLADEGQKYGMTTSKVDVQGLLK